MDFNIKNTETFKNIVEKIVDVRLQKKGITSFVAAKVTDVNSDGTVNVVIPPDNKRYVNNILNKTNEVLSVGDSVELSTKNGKLSNAWVAVKHGKNPDGVLEKQIDNLNNKVGDLNNLNTNDKSNVINAINEINNPQNKILWGENGDAFYMTSGHTATLSQKVSEQKNGIVLHWCYYDYVGGTGLKDYNNYYQYVPKQHVFFRNGKGCSTGLMHGTNFGDLACKYVYVYDDYIVGNDANSKKGTTNGITYDNKKYVLCGVIGV